MAGRYAIQKLIARGGMGEVYLARDDLLGRDVAIKVSRSSQDPKLLERFRREAQVGAQIDHPNVVRIFDLGYTEDDCPFLVMELLRGKRFTELLEEKGPMEADAVANLLGGIASALDLIHGKSIVHRDLKLDNLMLVERPDGAPRPKLLDFGVALSAAEEAPRLTVDGAFVGTPLYSAPEVLVGATPERSADIYSLAVVAYKLLTGVAPFEELGAQAMLKAKVGEEAVPPSWVRAGLSPELDPLFAAALSRDPSERPATASELIEGLRAPHATERSHSPGWTRAHAYFAGGFVCFVLAALVIWSATFL